MNGWIVYFGLPEFVLVSVLGLLAAGIAGWLLGRRGRKRIKASVLDGLPHGLMIVRADGQVVYANAEAGQLWGEAPLPAKLEGPWATLAGEGRRAARSLDTPSGLRLQVRAAPVDRDLVVLALEDMSARQRQESFYRDFISNVSHELKTPLTVIQGHLAASGDGFADDRWQTSRRIMTEEAARLTQLVDNLLLLSRLEMPDFVLDSRPVNLEAVIEDVILQLSDLAEAREVSLDLQREGTLPRIMADQARLKQVFLNLIDNAIKYNRQGGSVTVRLSADAWAVVVEVMDTGEGIPAQDLPYIFEKMYRVGRRQRRPVEGSGLGLSIVRRIVEQHKGSISVDSRLGEGSTFEIRLPRAVGDNRARKTYGHLS